MQDEPRKGFRKMKERRENYLSAKPVKELPQQISKKKKQQTARGKTKARQRDDVSKQRRTEQGVWGNGIEPLAHLFWEI